jgi:hypothetical protein
MNPAEDPFPCLTRPVPGASPEKTLRRLFLAIFLRGRSSRGLRKNAAPKSIGEKLSLTLFFYFLIGLFALSFLHQPVFALAVYLHAMTFVFLGMFVASSAGEVLFNKDENDILLHRPVTPKAMLWAKISVLTQVSLWLAGTFNFVGFFVGLAANDGGWLFPIVHAASTAMEALFCTGSVVLVYQLCLRWFGRERLDGLMTAAQVGVAVAAVLAGQILPRAMFRLNEVMSVGVHSWWVWLLPPAWFAGMDDAVAGHGSTASYGLTAAALVSTGLVSWVAFGKLAADYASGIQTLSEVPHSPANGRGRRRWLGALGRVPPLSWVLRDPVTRASFLLSAAYLFRDRDVKLRVYPGLAPMLVMPAILLVQDRDHGGMGGFGIAFAGAYLGVVPVLGLNLLRFSQQWQAADLFLAAPIPGPASLCQGARLAVLWILTLPLLLLTAGVAWFLISDASKLLLLVPGLLAIPVYSLVPCLNGLAVPLSQPTEEANSANRGLYLILAAVTSMVLAGLTTWSWHTGWLGGFVVIESVAVVILYFVLKSAALHSLWPSEE